MSVVGSGLRPYRSLVGATPPFAVNNAFQIAYNNASRIGEGDLVVPQTNGYLDVASTVSNPTLGVFSGCTFANPQNPIQPQTQKLWPGNPGISSTTTVTATYYDDPDLVYAVRANAPLTQSCIGFNANFVSNASPFASGVSSLMLDSSSVGTSSSLPFRIVELAPIGGNSFLSAFPVMGVALNTPFATAQSQLPASAGPLRCISTRGDLHNSTLAVASSKTMFKGRFQYAVGNNPAVSIRAVWDNFYQNAATSPNQEISNPDIVNLTAVAMVYNGVNVPITFSGSLSTVIAAGAVDTQSDPLEASAFGAGNYFAAGSTVEIRWEGTHANASAYVPVGSKTNIGPNDQMFRFLPANNINDVYSTGPMAAPVGADTPAVYAPTMLVGKFLGNTVAVLTIGDSIGDGGDDTNGIGLNGNTSGTAGNISGGGYSRRTPTKLGYAFCNMTTGGNRIVWFASQFTLRQNYFKYFTHAMVQLGDNDCAGGIAATSQKSSARTIWSALNGQGVQFIAELLILPKKDTDNYHQTDLVNQVDLSGYDGIRATLNGSGGNSYLADVGTHFLNAVYDINVGVQDTGDTTKWATTPFTTTLASAITAGATTASLTDAPTIGYTLVFDPGSATADMDNYITNVTGSGPYTVTLNGAFVNNHLLGAAVRGTPCYDGTHPTCVTHLTVTNILLTPYQAFTSTN